MGIIFVLSYKSRGGEVKSKGVLEATILRKKVKWELVWHVSIMPRERKERKEKTIIE